jgi:ribosomal protein L11 methyltransferase
MHAFRVILAADDEDLATAALWEAGTAGIEVRPAAGGLIELLAYFPDANPGAAADLLPPGARVERAEIPDVDWVRRFREGFHPFRVGRFAVTPVWLAGEEPGPDALVVNPGRAFGTGTHETTRLCLRALADVASRRPLGRALDLGSGTALLAVAATRLGARPVVASDTDPEATASSRAHALLNGAEVRVVRGDGGRPFRARAFDLVLANLTASLLLERRDEIRALLAPGAALVLSGILAEDTREVRSAFAGCGAPSERLDGEWAALVYDPVP